MFQLTQSVPVPEDTGRRGRRRKYPFHKMDIGDSFTVGQSRRDEQNLRQAVTNHRRRGGEGVFTVRRIGNEEVRCWRVS